jgi:hypothetical protein
MTSYFTSGVNYAHKIFTAVALCTKETIDIEKKLFFFFLLRVSHKKLYSGISGCFWLLPYPQMLD